MSQFPTNRGDGRRRYTHQAYDVTFLGKAMETGPSGYGKRLAATYDANIVMAADAGAAGAQPIGDLTQGLFIRGIINHAALTSGTLVLTMPAFGGEPEVVINTQAVDLTLTSVIFTGMNPAVLVPLTLDRPVVATVAGGTSGETALISLMVTPALNGWF